MISSREYRLNRAIAFKFLQLVISRNLLPPALSNFNLLEHFDLSFLITFKAKRRNRALLRLFWI